MVLREARDKAASELSLVEDPEYHTHWVWRHTRRCSSKCCVWEDEFPPNCRFVPSKYF